MLSKLTAEQMKAMSTHRLLEWFRKARKLYESSEETEAKFLLGESMLEARAELAKREHVKR